MTAEVNLIIRSQKGDRGSFSQLVEPYLDRSYRIALVLVGNHSDAEDVVQEAALKAFRSIHSIRRPDAFQSWFLRIVGNQARDVIKKHRRQQSRSAPNWVAEDIPDPDDPIADAILSADLRAAMDTLGDVNRTVILLRHGEGLSTDEIAQVLDRPPGTVRRWLSEAYAQMRQEMRGLRIKEGK